MKITEVSVHVSRTFNLGQYESVRVEVGASSTLEGKDEPEDVVEKMLPHVRTCLRTLYDSQVSGKGRGRDL